MTYILTTRIKSYTRRTWRQQRRRDGTWVERLCVCELMCVWVTGRWREADLTQKASRRPGCGWQWLWESGAGEMWCVCLGGGVSNRTGWSDVLFGVGGESASCFSPFFTEGCSQWRQLFEGANLEVTPCISLVVEGHMCNREVFPPPPYPP